MNFAARKPVRDRRETASVAPNVPHAPLRTGNAKAPKNEAAFTKMYPKPEAVALNRAGATSEQNDHELPLVLQGEGTPDQSDERQTESPHRHASVTDLREHDRGDETGDRREAEDACGHQVGANQAAIGADANAGDGEDDGQVEGPRRELCALAGIGDPSEDRSSPLDRVRPDDLEEVTSLRLLDLHVLVGEHVKRVIEKPQGDLFGFHEPATLDEGERGLRQVESREQKRDGGDGAHGESDPPENALTHASGVHGGDNEDADDLAEAEHELPAAAHNLPLAL